ncbi:vacuolar iron transporter Ccc1 [Cladorrhinum sp. PSN259]|nr:vacuolar iron transporter Ccc1 [Cladorrhinum sp. PSN259]
MPLTLLKTLFTLSRSRRLLQLPVPSSQVSVNTTSEKKPSTPPPSLDATDEDDGGSSTDIESQRRRQQQHREPPPLSADNEPSRHHRFINPRLISDATIGLSDGLTVPFALTAGLSALGDTRTVIFGGLAELIAGAISMGLGGYLGAKSEADSHRNLKAHLSSLLVTSPSALTPLLTAHLSPLNLPPDILDLITSHVSSSSSSSSCSSSPELISSFLLPPEPSTSRPVISALTISLGYFLGGLIPLIPYFCVRSSLVKALYVSVGVMALALFAFGYVKTGFTTGGKKRWGERRGKCIWGGCQMVLVGGMAAGAAMGLVKGLSTSGGGDGSSTGGLSGWEGGKG